MHDMKNYFCKNIVGLEMIKWFQLCVLTKQYQKRTHAIILWNK